MFSRIDAPRLHPRMDRLTIDAGIDQEMDDVDIFGAQFARHGLRDGAKAEFCGGERRKAGAAANARGRAGEQDSPRAALQHVSGSLAAHQKPRITGKLPRLEEQIA